MTCEQIDENVNICVEDNGCGMAPGVRARIFDPYFTTKESSDGTGLGMAITKKIVEEHEGTLGVESEEGKGTIVVLNLPTTPALEKMTA